MDEGKTETIHELLAPDAIAIGEWRMGKPFMGQRTSVPFVKNLRGAFQI